MELDMGRKVGGGLGGSLVRETMISTVYEKDIFQ